MLGNTIHSLVSILVEYWVNWKKSQMNLMWSAWNFYSRTCVIYIDPPVSSGPLTTLVFAKPLHWKPNRIRKRGEVELETGHIFWRIWIAMKKWCTWMNRSLFLCSSLKLQTNWVFPRQISPSFTTLNKWSTKITHHGFG